MMDCYNKYEIDIPSYLSKRTSNLHPAGSELFADWYNAELVNYKHPYLSIKESANYLWRIDWRELTEDEEVILTFKNGILVKKPD
jgi:hypothetical protein